MHSPRFGLAKIYISNIDSSMVAVKKYFSDNQDALEPFIQYNGQYVGTEYNNHPHLLVLYAFNYQEEANLIRRDTQYLTVYFEFCEQTLQNEIQKRQI